MTIWFSKRFNGIKKYCSKSISVSFRPEHWRMVKLYTNGAKRNNPDDICFDLNIHFLGIFFSYTNWDFNK